MDGQTDHGHSGDLIMFPKAGRLNVRITLPGTSRTNPAVSSR